MKLNLKGNIVDCLVKLLASTTADRIESIALSSEERHEMYKLSGGGMVLAFPQAYYTTRPSLRRGEEHPVRINYDSRWGGYFLEVGTKVPVPGQALLRIPLVNEEDGKQIVRH